MEYVGRDRVRAIVEEYDQKVLVLVLVTIYKLLNFNHIENPLKSTWCWLVFIAYLIANH
jgi:hypothetical protein